MSKTFSQNEHKILSMLGMCKGFNYNNKHYEIKIIGKPTSSSGEPKTDIYIYAESEDDNLEFKISFKQQNYEFLENKMSDSRAKEIFGDDWSNIIKTSLNNIGDTFKKKKLIYKAKRGKTPAGSFTLGWKFELLNVPSGALSGEIVLSYEQLYDVYAGSNLSDDKKNAMVNGNRIPESGVANCILIDDDYESVDDMISQIVKMDEYLEGHQKIYFACKALNYRSLDKKYDGNRPLSVYVKWDIIDGKLSGEPCFDEPLIHRGNEIYNNLIRCLNELGIENTTDISENNAWSDIVDEEE